MDNLQILDQQNKIIIEGTGFLKGINFVISYIAKNGDTTGLSLSALNHYMEQYMDKCTKENIKDKE